MRRTGSPAKRLSLIEQIGAGPAEGPRMVLRGWTSQDGEFGEGKRGVGKKFRAHQP